MSYTTFAPNYAVSPGDILEEQLEARNIQKQDFAARTGLSPKHISQILAGKASLSPEVAIQFERVLGMEASVWMGLENNYRLFLAREEEKSMLADSIQWAKQFPVAEMEKLGWVTPQKTWDAKVMELLRFFSIARAELWESQYSLITAYCRKSKKKDASVEALSAWYRKGLQKAENSVIAPYDINAFKSALSEMRALTQLDPKEAIPKAIELCNNAGVYLVVEPHLKGTYIHGITSWLATSPLIQLSMRSSHADVFWFSLFHEAAHILLHSKKQVFIDGDDYVKSETEVQADTWARNHLIGIAPWKAFVAEGDFHTASIQKFAKQIGVGADIVVGRLQFENYVSWKSPLNQLKNSVA